MNYITTRFQWLKPSEESQKYLLYSVGVACVGVFGYFTYRLIFKKKSRGSEDSSEDDSERVEADFVKNQI
jgi:hypothetical protein